MPAIVKKDDRREQFDRRKLREGLIKACEKRPVSVDAIEETADRIERSLLEMGEKEVDSSVIGEAVMRSLHKLDTVAYVRFASVYRSFQDIDEFMNELQDLLRDRRKSGKKGGKKKRRETGEVTDGPARDSGRAGRAPYAPSAGAGA